MCARTFAGLIAALCLAGISFAADDTGDVKRLQGTWVVDPAMYKDVKDHEAVKALKAIRVVFQGDSVTFKHPPGNEETGPFRLDPTRTPKQIDLIDAARGIYELRGNSLKLCWDQRGKANGRPTKFAHDKAKETVHYLLLKREKK